jgi:DNA-binding transcriptional LysR family regulator
MDLRQLTYLVAVADEGGVRAAARRLTIGPPQISQALRRLEGELGVELMRRTRRGIELSADGEELLARSRDILQRVDAARSALSRTTVAPSTKLRLGLVAGLLSAGELVGPILAAYRDARPDVELQVVDLGMCDQVSPLVERFVDAAIVRPPVGHPDVIVTPFAREPRVLMVGASHELADEDSVHLDDVLAMPTLPLAARLDWAHFWQLNDERGGGNHDREVAPAQTVAEAQFTVGTRPVLVTSPATMARLAPNPFIRFVRLTGASPTIIGLARNRHDDSRAVRDLVRTVQATAERYIHLLPDGELATAG